MRNVTSVAQAATLDWKLWNYDAEQLEGYECEGRLGLGADDLYGIRFRRGRETVDVPWSYRKKNELDTLRSSSDAKDHPLARRPGEPWLERWKHSVEVSLPIEQAVAVTNLMGNRQVPTVVQNHVKLRLSGTPIYVRGLGAMSVRKNVW
jgi:hypothetical protein